jgi:tetratricopeptide (TPR) repeat protein
VARDITASSEHSAAFVGRERELAELRGGLDNALDGRGRLFLVVGEPGIGKTRLAEEVAASAQARAALVLWGRCWEGGGAPVYWPWVQIVRTLARASDAQTLARHLGAGASYLAQWVPELREQLGNVADVPITSAVASEHARFPLFDATTSFLKSVAGARPLVLLLDDLHTADQPSLLLLQFLARELQDARMLIVGTYREVEMQRLPETARIISDVARRGHRIPLGGLSADDVARIMQTTFALSPSRALASAVHETTEGNPFFVDEVVRLLVAEDPLHPPADVPAGGLHIPHGVRDAIRERLRPLSERCIQTVATAAVIGREFALAVLQGCTEMPAADLLDVLQEAEAGGIVARLPGALPRYSFKHALIRETLYEDLLAGQRMLLHRRIGEVLERIHAHDPQPHLAQLAHHFLQAAPGGDADKAIHYAVRAAERATTLLAYEEAAARYAQAIEALALQPGGNESRRIELLLALGEAQARAWNADSARSTFLHAAEVAGPLTSTIPEAATLLARAALGIGRTGLGVPRGGVVDRELAGLLEAALHALGDQDSALRAQLLARLAVELYFSDSAERRVALSTQAVDMARRVGDTATLAYVVNARHFALWDSPDVAERLAVATEGVELAERAGDHEMAVQAHCWRLLDVIEIGDTAAWDRELGVIVQLAERLRQPRLLSFAATLHGMRALWRGQFDDVDAFVQQALAIGNRVQDEGSVVSASLQMFAVARARGRLAALEPMVKSWVERVPASPATRCMLAIVYTDLARETDARREFELLAAQDFANLHRVNGLNALLPWLAEVCALLGDTRRARLLSEYLSPLAGLNILGGPRICFGPAAYALGLVATTLGDLDAAARYFEEALARSTQMRGAPAVATTQYEYARVLLTRRQQGDRQKALSLIADAAAGATALGMLGLAEKADTLAQTAPTMKDTNVAPHQEVRRAVAGGGQQDPPQMDEGESTTAEPAAEGKEPPSSGRVLHFPTKRRRKTTAPSRVLSGGPHEATRAAVHADEGIFRREGEYWSVGDASAVVRLRDTKGLRYIAQLLHYPGREFHVTDLLAPEQPVPGSPLARMSDAQLRQLGMQTASSTTAEPLLDAAARAAYKRRIGDLRDQLDEATRFNDIERAAQARREIEFLTQELARAVGLRGRGRAAASHAERARLNITRAIRSVIKRISAGNPNLGRYLTTTVKTGTFCSYTPDPRIPMVWKL